MHRKLMISYQCYKLLNYGRHINQLPQKCSFKSPLVAQGRCLSSTQSPGGDGDSPPATAPPIAATPSQSEAKMAKESLKEAELTGGKRDQSEGATAAAAAGASGVEPPVMTPAVEQVEPPIMTSVLEPPAVEQVEPQLTAAAAAGVEAHLQNQTVEQVEPPVKAPVTPAGVEPSVTAPAVEQVEPSVTASAVEQMEPSVTAPAAAGVEPSVTAPAVEQMEPSVTAPVVEQMEPSVTASAAAGVEPSVTVPVVELPVTAPAVEQVETHLQAPVVEPPAQTPVAEQVEPLLKAPVVKQVEPLLKAPVAEQASAAEEPVEHHVGDVGVMTSEVKGHVGDVVVETVKSVVAPPSEQKEAEQSVAAETDSAKGGKKGLLELLGAMKVDVTTKRKVRTPRPLVSEQPIRSKATPPLAVTRETTKGMFQEASAAAAVEDNNMEKAPGLAPDLVAAATAAASTLPNRGQATSELLRQLRRHEAQAHSQQRGGENISDIIADMKVGRRANGRLDTRPANQIRFDEDGRGYTHDRGITSELDGVRRRKSSLSARRLNVFTTKPDESPAPAAGLWNLDLANRIAMATNQLPRNGFEEMLLWTNEGKLWQYPINNEAGLEEEASVPFHEHVFLERHLSQGFPAQGPVRHFMELVVAGLAKNPYLTANQKQEHIAWFRDYFQEKRAVLEEAEGYAS